MRIEPVAVWTVDSDRIGDFYIAYFGAVAGVKYVNSTEGFESYSPSFPSGGARIELMRASGRSELAVDGRVGSAHPAVALGSEVAVNDLANRLRADGIEILNGPGWTGDGYYESVILDPEGNRIESTI